MRKDVKNDCKISNNTLCIDDIEVQEVFEGQTSLLLPPKAKFKLPSSSPQAMSPMRSLTPCDAVPRPAFLRCVSDVNDVYKLRRPSSHYDAQAQAASSRPTSRPDHSCHTAPCQSPPVPPLFGPVQLHCESDIFLSVDSF